MASVHDPCMATMRDRPSRAGGPVPSIRPRIRLGFLAVGTLGLAAVAAGAGRTGRLAGPYPDLWHWVLQQ